MKETRNHLVIRQNTIRNVGVVRHNHTIIEKEIRYKRRPAVLRVVDYVMQQYQTVYKPAIVYVPYIYPVRYSVPHHYYPKQYHYPQHHYQRTLMRSALSAAHYPQHTIGSRTIARSAACAAAYLQTLSLRDVLGEAGMAFVTPARYSGARNDSSFLTRKS